MTREEAIEKVKMILEEATEDEGAVCYVTSCDADALDMAIKALEQTEPERKPGKWLKRTDKTKELYGWYQCSQCGAIIGEPVNYCSECGSYNGGTE